MNGGDFLHSVPHCNCMCFQLVICIGHHSTACGLKWMVAAISPIQIEVSLKISLFLGKTGWPVQILTLHSTVEHLLPPLLLLELRNWNSEKQREYQLHTTQIRHHHLCWFPHGHLLVSCTLDNLMASWHHFPDAPNIPSSYGIAFHSGCNWSGLPSHSYSPIFGHITTLGLVCCSMAFSFHTYKSLYMHSKQFQFPSSPYLTLRCCHLGARSFSLPPPNGWAAGSCLGSLQPS